MEHQENREHEREVRHYPLANRRKRLLAAMIDGFIGFLLLLPVYEYYDFFEWWALPIEQREPLPVSVVINLLFYIFASYLILHSYLLYYYGQTIGKRIMRIAVATLDFQVPAYNRLIALRYLPFHLASLFPPLALLPIVDLLYIFRQDHRCLHDHMAGTQVIDISDL